MIVSLHGLGYYVVWLDQGNWTGGLSWNASNTNLLAGTIAWLCGCILWASSITWVRRNFYEVHSLLLLSLATSVNVTPHELVGERSAFEPDVFKLCGDKCNLHL